MLSRALITGVVATFCVGLASAGEFDDASGYRTDRYRSPVDRPVQGGRRIELAELDRLIAGGAALIDVMPARVGYDPRTGRWLLAEPRKNIPGSVWLPEVGRGVLDAKLSAYFEGSLARMTERRSDRPLVFYCMADCWMSWNAVKRAASLGYHQVYWYPDGSDGWRDADRPLVDGDPWPVGPEPTPGPGHAQTKFPTERPQ